MWSKSNKIEDLIFEVFDFSMEQSVLFKANSRKSFICLVLQ